MAAPLPKGWAEYTNEEGAPYFHNADKNETSVRGRPTTWTVLQQDGPNHLGLRYNAMPDHQMALITSGCVPFSGSTRSTRPSGVCPHNMDCPPTRWP